MNEQTTKTAPLFLVGTGRCGSTIAYSLLAMHPDLAWISSWVDAFPRHPTLAVGNRLWDLPGMDTFRELRFSPKPVEPNTICNHILSDYFSELINDQVIEEARSRLLPYINKIQNYHARPRFLAKMVGRPVKINLLSQIFPDACFIYTTRQLRPTVSSLLLVDFYQGNESLTDWKWGTIPEVYREFYEQRGQANEIAAAIKVMLNQYEIEHQLASIDSSRWMELPYAEFVSNPIEHLSEIGKRFDLAIDNTYVDRLSTRRVYGGADDKWKKYFSETQLKNLSDFESLKIS